ncbi:MAG: hypothetical protein ACTSVU_00710 [Promethearchaeota archaeon]
MSTKSFTIPKGLSRWELYKLLKNEVRRSLSESEEKKAHFKSDVNLKQQKSYSLFESFITNLQESIK